LKRLWDGIPDEHSRKAGYGADIVATNDVVEMLNSMDDDFLESFVKVGFMFVFVCVCGVYVCVCVCVCVRVCVCVCARV